eukprot:206416-Pleurochrysis_carterae.AAC.1
MKKLKNNKYSKKSYSGHVKPTLRISGVYPAPVQPMTRAGFVRWLVQVGVHEIIRAEKCCSKNNSLALWP